MTEPSGPVFPAVKRPENAMEESDLQVGESAVRLYILRERPAMVSWAGVLESTLVTSFRTSRTEDSAATEAEGKEGGKGHRRSPPGVAGTVKGAVQPAEVQGSLLQGNQGRSRKLRSTNGQAQGAWRCWEPSRWPRGSCSPSPRRCCGRHVFQSLSEPQKPQ